MDKKFKLSTGEKLGDAEKNIIFIAIAILLVAVVYFVFFTNFWNKGATVAEENKVLSDQLATLQDMESRKDATQRETEEYNAKIDEIVSKYPSYVSTETVVSNVIQMENNTGLVVTNYSFLMDNLLGYVYRYTAEDIANTTVTTDENGEETTEQTATGGEQGGYYAATTLNYSLTYDQLKALIAYINQLPDRTTMPTININLDTETGNLTGSMTLNMYYMTGTDREYVAPSAAGVPTGVTDIFNSTGVNGSAYSDLEGEYDEDGNLIVSEDDEESEEDMDEDSEDDEDEDADSEDSDEEEDEDADSNNNNSNSKNKSR